MAKKDAKFFICMHATCAFKTDKRKAIYTHLVRTHSERKEDYECEYCSEIFHQETDIEEHLQVQHPTQPFTYTCVSRIENVINKCAKLGAESKRALTPIRTNENSSDTGKRPSTDNKTPINIKSENGQKGKGSLSLRQRTKASVNESLNNIAKQPKFSSNEKQALSIKQEKQDDSYQDGDLVRDCGEESNTCISKPSGIKLKLNLKKIAECSSREASRSRSKSPPYLERNVVSSEIDMDSSNVIASSPPNIIHNKSGGSCGGGVIREKASKYYDRLEVYHRTDEFGRRCCPFCPYKTSKNTIRVHLSGIHKVHFVKCSLCDYKAAFPHQITQHGVKFHKTTTINVIQLSKDSRDRTIGKLPKPDDWEPVPTLPKKHANEQPESYNYSFDTLIENDNSNGGSVDIGGSNSEESCPSSDEEENGERRLSGPVDTRVFKPPKCQTSKTDYYSIQHENGVYMYSCNMCSFQTPVRATIYTHKYRHEEKAYRCGYCEFTSSPRSNVVHHCRSRHKHQPVSVVDIGEHDDDGPRDDVVDSGNDQSNSEGLSAGVKVKTEPMDETSNVTKHQQEQTNVNQKPTVATQPDANNKNHQTIIKVPQFKRTLTSVAYNPVQKADGTKRQKISQNALVDYKISLNKQYKINPSGSPKYLCAECPYACDTHPKMKHHLYRHRPQSYKCPYCDHRKYPRSYVVRHVRDTHRNKPVRVIDLAKGNQLIDIPEYMDHNEAIDALEESLLDDPEDGDGSVMEGDNDLGNSMQTYMQQEMEHQDESTNIIPPHAIKRENTSNSSAQFADESATINTGCTEENLGKVSPIVGRKSLNENSALREALKLNTKFSPNFEDEMFTQTPDVSPNFSEAVYTSTPLIESIINGQYNNNSTMNELQTPNSKVATKNFEKKKSMKDYRVNFGPGPRYICNICGYGTENYKTIHNHMYRHESQRYQCPYCGYRRSPKSFVENHIREVHKGHPVIVTELNLDIELAAPLGSPRQRLNLKRKDPVQDQASPPQPLTPPVKKPNTEDASVSQTAKLSIKWPAPKPASQVNLTIPSVSVAPQLQIPVKQRTSGASPVPVLPPINVPIRSVPMVNNTTLPESSISNSHTVTSNTIHYKPEASTTPSMKNKSPPQQLNSSAKPQVVNNNLGKTENPFKFKEGSRTTYKTMYKCVFDPETCNHISKDKSKMKQHLFMHVEYKPWCCDFCDMTASQSSHAKNHVRTEHPGKSDMSFKYKRHNYLEKHIDGFLTKGLFTVPVNEYRVIMDMKGNTKTANRSTFSRDTDGNILCPHCDYKTKSGGMTDHVKMKHMQPRFKCRWCDYKAFYRSEIRKHHRKEKSHNDVEFKTQELDLVEVMEGYKAANNSATLDEQDTQNKVNPTNNSDDGNLHNDLMDDDMDDYDDDEFDDDLSSNDGSSLGDISSLGYIEYTTEQLSDLCSGKSAQFGHDENPLNMTEDNAMDGVHEDTINEHTLPENVNTEVTEDGCMKIVQASKLNTTIEGEISESKFKCGYCSFSAELRVKVKMHCSKKHLDNELLIVDPVRHHEGEIRQQTAGDSDSNNVVRVNANDWKGTRFEQDLKKAGVSKLNLASLFPHSKRFSNESGEEYENDDNEDEDDIDDDDESDAEITEEPNDENSVAGAHLVIPFKKATQPSMIDIPLTHPLLDRKVVDTDAEFKKPLDPLPSPKFNERRRERLPKTQNLTRINIEQSPVHLEKAELAHKSLAKERSNTVNVDCLSKDSYIGISNELTNFENDGRKKTEKIGKENVEQKDSVASEKDDSKLIKTTDITDATHTSISVGLDASEHSEEQSPNTDHDSQEGYPPIENDIDTKNTVCEIVPNISLAVLEGSEETELNTTDSTNKNSDANVNMYQCLNAGSKSDYDSVAVERVKSEGNHKSAGQIENEANHAIKEPTKEKMTSVDCDELLTSVPKSNQLEQSHNETYDDKECNGLNTNGELHVKNNRTEIRRVNSKEPNTNYEKLLDKHTNKDNDVAKYTNTYTEKHLNDTSIQDLDKESTKTAVLNCTTVSVPTHNNDSGIHPPSTKDQHMVANTFDIDDSHIKSLENGLHVAEAFDVDDGQIKCLENGVHVSPNQDVEIKAQQVFGDSELSIKTLTNGVYVSPTRDENAFFVVTELPVKSTEKCTVDDICQEG